MSESNGKVDWWDAVSVWRLYGIRRDGKTFPLMKGNMNFHGSARDANLHAMALAEDKNFRSWFLRDVSQL